MEVRFAKVKAGHDKNHIYMIKEEMGEYVFLVNGKTKCLINPRKKAKKHVQIIKLFLEETEISDRMTAKALQEYEIINKTRKNRNQED